MIVRLVHAGWELTLRPDLGGSIASFRRDGADILRPTPAGAKHPLDTSCFPLVPYANRIANGHFSFAGAAYALPTNVEGQSHPLHGVGWLAAWRVLAANDRSATIVHDHDGDARWPWAYTAEQRLDLSDDGLHIALTIANRAERAMPVSLGLHPYFTTTAVDTLRLDADGMWLTDTGMLPTERVAVNRLGDWMNGAPVKRNDLIDNSFEGWSGEAIITRHGRNLRLSGENTPVLHLFLPPGEDFFCVEPVTVIPDAINRMPPSVLLPGESHAIGMAITAVT